MRLVPADRLDAGEHRLGLIRALALLVNMLEDRGGDEIRHELGEEHFEKTAQPLIIQEGLKSLFETKYLKEPKIARKPSYDIAGMQAVLNAEIQQMPEYKKAYAAVRALAAAVVAKYDVETANVSVGSMGLLMIAHDANSHSSSYANDVINTERRKRNQEATAENLRLGNSIEKELQAWNLERIEKLNVIACADNINQVLALVPEVRVNLPTEFDREASKNYQQGQLTAGAIIDV